MDYGCAGFHGNREMPLNPSWPEIALRLALTIVAGALIGANREARGHAAGLRTTMLVTLAASVAMIQMNLLLPVSGKTGASFSVMDVMRLPLGILSGMGFIGAGAILRRGELVTGVTTAATLWTATVIGLCFGGGQLALGAIATILATTILWLLKELDRRFIHVQRATLRLSAAAGTDVQALVQEAIPPRYGRMLADLIREDERTVAIYDVKWRDVHGENPPLAEISRLKSQPGVREVAWIATTKRD